MPRVYLVKKARKPQGTCGKCGCALKKGDSYKYWEFRYGGRRVRCVKPECAPRPADLTQSEFLSSLYNIQDTKFEGDTIEDIESTLEDVKGELENMANECDEKLNNMPDSLREAPTGQLLQERVDACNDAVSELDGVDLSFDEPEKEKDEDDEKYEERRQAAEKERCEEIAQELQDALSNISCS